MSVEFGTTTVHGWETRHETGEWGVRWPDGTVHQCFNGAGAYATVENHRAKGIKHTSVAVRRVRTVVGQWEDTDGLILLAEPEDGAEELTAQRLVDIALALAREYATVTSTLCADIRVPKDLRDQLLAHTGEVLDELPARIRRLVDAGPQGVRG